MHHMILEEMSLSQKEKSAHSKILHTILILIPNHYCPDNILINQHKFQMSNKYKKIIINNADQSQSYT